MGFWVVEDVLWQGVLIMLNGVLGFYLHRPSSLTHLLLSHNSVGEKSKYGVCLGSLFQAQVVLAEFYSSM